MQAGIPEELFERYRSRGDVAAMGELFDRTAPELLSLAVRLAPSVAEAEDLVQATFLALIERPKAFKAGSRLMPFLAGILARQAGTARRRARRSPDVRRLAPRESESPERALLAAEVDDELRAAFERVPELYREVLRQHLVEGRRPIEIAVRLGRTPGTIAQQLLRGLEQLRRVLPRGLAGGAAVHFATRGEAAIRAAVVRRAGELAGASASAGLTLATLGGTLMSLKSAAIPAALGAALLAWIAWPDAPKRNDLPAVAVPEAAGARSLPESAVLSGASTPERVLASAPALGSEPTLEASRANARPGSVTLVARLHGVAPEHAAEFVVEAQCGGGSVSGATDAAGVARLEVGMLFATMPEGSREPLSVTAKHPFHLDGHEFVHRKDGSAEVLECVLSPRPASVLAGRVRVPIDADVRHIRVELRDERGELASFPFFGTDGPCDVEGRFEMKLSATGLHSLTLTSPDTLPFEAWCALEAGERLELPDIELASGGAEIRGTVRLPDGAAAQPFGGIDVHASWRGPAHEPPARVVIDRENARSFAVLRGGPRPTRQVCALASDGTFALRGLEAGPWELEVHGVAASALLPMREPRIVHAPASGVVLWDERCLLTALVSDTAGPVDGADVTWSARAVDTFTSQQTFTGSDGRASVVGDASQDYTLTVRRAGGEPVVVPWPAVGRGITDTKRIELAASAASTLVLRLAPGSAELPTASLRLEPRDEGKPARDLRAPLEGGAYRFEEIEPGRYRALVGPSDDRGPVGFFGEPVQTKELDVELAPGSTSELTLALEAGGRVRIEVDAEPPTDGWLALELLGPDGVARPFTGVAALSAGEGFGTFAAVAGALHLSGSNAIQEALAPGRYLLRRVGDGWLVEAPPFEVRAGETTTLTLVARKP